MTHTTLTNILSVISKDALDLAQTLNSSDLILDRIDSGYANISRLLLLELADTQRRNINHHPSIATGLVAQSDYSTALRWAKQGFRIARAGWNGKHMWVFVEGLDTDAPYMSMHTAQGTLQKGWLPSQADNFANDWIVLYDPAIDSPEG